VHGVTAMNPAIRSWLTRKDRHVSSGRTVAKSVKPSSITVIGAKSTCETQADDQIEPTLAVVCALAAAGARTGVVVAESNGGHTQAPFFPLPVARRAPEEPGRLAVFVGGCIEQ
jgi:hypothetical protein